VKRRSLRPKSKGKKSSVFEEEVKKKGKGSQGKMKEEGKDNDMLISVDNGIKWKLKDLRLWRLGGNSAPYVTNMPFDTSNMHVDKAFFACIKCFEI